VLLDHLSIPFVKIIAPQILVGLTVAQKMIDNHQNAMSNRDGGFLRPSSGCNPTILSGQIRVFTVRSSVSGLNEELTSIRIAFASLARKAFARTLMISW
jgi:hypothetical protein